MEAGGRRPFGIRICSEKGGQGKTIIAVNLSVALADLGYKVLLLDTDPFIGGVVNQLKIPPPAFSFEEIVKDKIDIKKGICTYKAGKIDIISNTTSAELPCIKPSLIDKAAEQLLGLDYEFVIGDSAAGANENPAFKYYNSFIDVLDNLSISVYSERVLVERYKKKGLDFEIVLNNFGKNQKFGMEKREIESILGKKIGVVVPYDPIVIESFSKFKPAYLLNKQSGFSLAMAQLAKLCEGKIQR